MSANRGTNIERNKHIDNITTLYHHTNATPIRAQKDIGYGCCFCEKFCATPAELKIHTKLAHRSEKPQMRHRSVKNYHVKLDITDLQCNECNARIDKLEDMMLHLKETHKEVIHLDINNQIMPFKFNGGEFKCVFCGTEFHKFKKLAEHMHRHYRNCVCVVCGAGFINEKSFHAHFQAHQTGVFPCKFCEKVFNTTAKKKAHESAVHIHSQLLNKCGYCDKKFKTHRSKQKHIASEHGVSSEKYLCKQCEKVCLTANALRVHIRRIHLKERPHACQLCDFSSYKRVGLYNHMLKHTGVKNFQCDVCQKFYARKKTLREHMRIHEDDRRFMCGHCGCAFVQNCSLKAHLRSKHGACS